MTIIVYLAPGENAPDEAPDLSSHWEVASAGMQSLGDFDKETRGDEGARWAAFAASDGTITRMVAGGEGGVADLFRELLEWLRGDLYD